MRPGATCCSVGQVGASSGKNDVATLYPYGSNRAQSRVNRHFGVDHREFIGWLGAPEPACRS
jgi:hypothetical protein